MFLTTSPHSTQHPLVNSIYLFILLLITLINLIFFCFNHFNLCQIDEARFLDFELKRELIVGQKLVVYAVCDCPFFAAIMLADHSPFTFIPFDHIIK